MDIKTLKRLLGFCKPYRQYILLVGFLSIVSVVLTLTTPVLFGQAIDILVGIDEVNLTSLFQQLLIVGGVVGLGALSQWVLARITNTITYNITRDLRDQVFYKIQKLPLPYIDGNLHGDLLSRIINDIDLIAMGLLQSFTSLFTGIVTIIGTIVIMCLINVSIASIVIIITPISLIVSSIIAKKTYVYFQEQLAMRGEMSGYVEEMIGNQKIVKAFGYEQRNEEKFDEINQKMHVSGVKSQFLGALINPTTRVINSFVYVAVGVFGAISVINGNFSVGLLSSFLMYANQYTKPFNEISAVMSEMQTALAACSRVFTLLDEGQEEELENTPVTLQEVKGAVIMEEVSFSYQLGKPFIEHMNISVQPGHAIAIVGKTGCGKTTLINLLMRFYEQDKGNILIDGVDILTMDKTYLRSLYGMVLQDSWLFEGTIRENIAYGRTDASESEVIEAATKARAHKFIIQLPDGYDTIVEEDGGNMSQGQRQLLCIARVMLSKPPMLILDEATSSIDTRTELQIQSAFDEMMKGRTTFIVAHRLSTIKNADLILVMDNGHIIEQGTHSALLEKQGYYHKLYNSQFDVKP